MTGSNERKGREKGLACFLHIGTATLKSNRCRNNGSESGNSLRERKWSASLQENSSNSSSVQQRHWELGREKKTAEWPDFSLPLPQRPEHLHRTISCLLTHPIQSFSICHKYTHTLLPTRCLESASSLLVTWPVFSLVTGAIEQKPVVYKADGLWSWHRLPECKQPSVVSHVWKN